VSTTVTMNTRYRSRSRQRTRERKAALAAVAALGAGMLWGPVALAVISCSTTVPSLAFGTYDPTLANPTDITTSMTVTCTRGFLESWSVSYSVELSTGNSGTYAARRMNAGTAQLNYNVYTNASHSQVWGDGTSSTGVVGTTMHFNFFQFSNSATHTAYGRIPAGQDAGAGNYGDNLIVTLSF
jgi:spore coat protein U-like protein